MTKPELEEKSLSVDIEKKQLEMRLLERAAKLDALKAAATVLGALALVFGFTFDRYKIHEQREADRRAAIVAEFDALYSRTLTALRRPRPDTILLRTNVEAYKDHLRELEKALSKFPETIDRDKEAVFLRESSGLADQLLAHIPVTFEFTQWTEAIELEGAWQEKVQLVPDLAEVFGPEFIGKWKSLRESAIAALHKTPLLNEEDPSSVRKFQEQAAAFQHSLYQDIEQRQSVPISFFKWSILMLFGGALLLGCYFLLARNQRTWTSRK